MSFLGSSWRRLGPLTASWYYRSMEKKWANCARRFVKAELKRAEVSYAELARRLKEHGLGKV